MPVINLGGDGSAPDDPSNGGQWIPYPDGTWGPPGGGFGPYGGRSTPYGPPQGTTINSIPQSTPSGFDLGSLLGISSAQARELPLGTVTGDTSGVAPQATAPQAPAPTATGVTVGGRAAGPVIAPHPFSGGNQPFVPASQGNVARGGTFLHRFINNLGTPGALSIDQPGHPSLAGAIQQGETGDVGVDFGPAKGTINARLPPFTARARPTAAPAYQAAPTAAPQQPYSPFTMVLRPNAPAGQSGGRGGGGPDLTTALDLSNWGRGYQPPPPPSAPRYVNLGYGAPPAATAPRAAPVRATPDMTVQQLRHPWSPFTPGQGTPPSPIRQPYNPFATFGTPT